VNSRQGVTAWWRWPLFPVGAILGSWLVSLAPVIATTLFKGQWLDTHEGTWFEIYVVMGASAFFGGYTLGHLSCSLAPSRKIVAGILMVALFSALQMFVTIDAWLHNDPLAARSTLMTVIFGLTAPYAIYKFYKGEG